MVEKNRSVDSMVVFWDKSKYFRPKPLGRQGNENYVKARSEYRELMNKFLTNVQNALLDGHTVVLPAYLGRLSIQGVEMGTLRVHGWNTRKARDETGDESIIIRVKEYNDNVEYKLHYEFNAGYQHTYWYKAETPKYLQRLIWERLNNGQSYFIRYKRVRKQNIKVQEEVIVPYDETNDKW